MTDQTNVASPAPAAAGASDSLPTRLIGVLFSPQATFARLIANPHWVGALITISLSVAIIFFAFLSTEVGQGAWLDQQVRQSEAFGRPVDDKAYTALEQMAPNARYLGAGAVLVFSPIMTMAIAGILIAVFNALLGGSATFKQVAAVVTHAGAVTLVQQLFIAPLNYARESMSSATNLAVFVPFLEESNLVARFLGIIDLFIIWWLLVLAIGLGVLYRRKTAPIFWSFIGIYVVIALVVAVAIWSASGGA